MHDKLKSMTERLQFLPFYDCSWHWLTTVLVLVRIVSVYGFHSKYENVKESKDICCNFIDTCTSDFGSDIDNCHNSNEQHVSE